MSPQEENRLIAAITVVESKVDGINVRLDRLNGQVMKNQENIARHDNQFASVLAHMGSFDQNAQDIKIMNLPRMIERVDWMYRFFWIMAGGILTTLIGIVFTYFSK